MSAIRRSLKDGLLGDASNVRASRTKAGPFESLRGYPEFRDLVIEAAPLSVPQAPSPRQSIAPTDETVPTQHPLKPGSARPIITPTAPRKPHIGLDDIPSSTSAETLKWLFLFALFVVTAAVAFWFFG